MISKVSVSRFAMSVACMALCAAVRAETMVLTNDLTTSWGRAVTPENVWREYPRPQLVRGEWTSLNGTWEYAITSAVSDVPTKVAKGVRPFYISSTVYA